MQQLERHRLAPLLIDMLIGVHLRRREALLSDRAARTHEPGRVALIGRINLISRPDPLSHEHLRERPTTEHVDGDPLLAQVSDTSHIGIGLRIPHDHLRVALQRRHHRHQRSNIPMVDLLISRRITQMDALIDSHVLRHRREPDSRTTRADLPLNAQVGATQNHRTPNNLVVHINDVIIANQLIHRPMLRLREPIRLNHQRRRTHIG